PAVGRLPPYGLRLVQRSDGRRVDLPTRQIQRRNMCAYGIGLHKQGMQRPRQVTWPARRGADERRGLEARAEREARPATRPALNGDVAAHQNDQLARDCQAEPRSAARPCQRAIDLVKRLEDPGALIWLDADPGILHRKVENDRVTFDASQGHL